jgi:hypothetical protein
MIKGVLPRALRPPGSRWRRLSRLLLLLVGAALPAGCIYVPTYVEGVPAGASWVALPLAGWLSEGGVRAEAITACFAPDCAPRAGVGVFRASGDEARTVEAALRHPERLARLLQERAAAAASTKRPGAGRAIQTVTPLKDGSLAGFTLAMAREDGSRAAHAAVIGKRSGEALRFVIVVGADEEAVRATAREVVAKLR